MVDIKPEPSTSRKKKATARAHSSDDSAAEEPTPDRKRPRTSTNGKRAAAASGDDDESGEDETGHAPVNEGLVRDTDGYVMGSITCIKCQNFLTYDSVEFTPGPALNMVIGPNGTGKSTIACAIAIGLGFNASVLGRSSKTSQYVKMGSDPNAEAWVEIELKGRPGKKNLVVRRVLAREKDSSQFYLDGAHATNAAVSAKMEELNVQITNLCTFLPQDRVAHFSQLTHPELLVETQRAAGDRNLSGWHKTLKEEQVLQKKGADNLDRLADKLKRRETKQAEAEKEVKQFEQRADLEQKQAVVDLLLKYAQYDDAQGRWREAKEMRNLAESEIAELEAENKPFLDSQAALKHIIADFATLKEQTSKRGRKLASQGEETAKQIEQAQNDIEKSRDALEAASKEERLRKQEITKLKKEVEALEKAVTNKPEPADEQKWRKGRQVQVSEKADVAEKITSIHAEVDEIDRSMRSLTKREADHERRLQEFGSQKQQRWEATKRFEPDTAKAYAWFTENKDRFKGKCFAPARLTVFVKPEAKNLVDLIEAPISLNAWKTFLFEEREDYQLMMREFVDSGLGRINGQMIPPGKTRADYPNFCDNETLQKLGFDCFPVDLLEGPEPVLAWLADAHGLNKFPLQTRPRPLNETELDKVRALTRYYTLDGSTSVKFSNYGNRLSQREQRALAPAKILSAGHDTSKSEAIKTQLQEIRAQKGELSSRHKKLLATESDLQDRAVAINEELRQLTDSLEQARKPIRKWEEAKARLQTKRGQLSREQNKPSEEAKRTKLKETMTKLAHKRLALALRHKDIMDKATQTSIDSVQLHLRHLQAESDLRAMDNSSSERDQILRAKEEHLVEVKARTKELFTTAKATLAIIHESEESAEPEIKERATARRTAEDLTVDGLEGELTEITTALAMTAAISPEVLKAYNQRKQEIIDGRAELEAAQQHLAETDDRMKRTYDLWKPRLDTLVENISKRFRAAFDSLGLTGEVKLDEKDDYDQWGIQILVSFRDNTPLHVLSPQRQSGGERALTTVMYLMSLAELAQSPFALVDEINQGMDQRVERQVHNALVRTTCKDDVGQYFLLTPKLLPNLNYDPLMKVLVIQSGCWLPSKRITLADIAKKKLRQVRAQAIAAH